MRPGVGTVRKQQHDLREKRVSSSEPKDLVCTNPAAPGNSQEVMNGEVRRPKTVRKKQLTYSFNLIKQGSRGQPTLIGNFLGARLGQVQQRLQTQ